MEQLNIPEEMRAKLMAQLGVTGEHIDEALSLAQKSPTVGATPFLQHMRKLSEFFKTFSHAGEKLARFSSLPTVADKLELVREAVLSHPQYRDVVGVFPPGSLEDRDTAQQQETSRQLRDKGNKLYQAKKFPEATRLYTEAALAAGPDSKGCSREMALAMGNRSAVYFQQEDWARCQEDLEAALLYGYPEELQYRLAERRGRVELRQGRMYEAQESLELAGNLVKRSKLSEEQKTVFRQELKSSLEQGQEGGSVAPVRRGARELPGLLDPHPAIPGLTDAAEVCYSSARGRHTVTRTTVEAGQLVVTDSPLAWCLSSNHALTHCHHCCLSLAGAGYPSPLARRVSETVMFCSLSCLHTASLSYHRVESQLPLSSLFQSTGSGGRKGGYDEISGALLLVLRCVTQQSPAFWTCQDWLGQASQRHVETEVNDDDDIFVPYRTLFNLVTHSEGRSEADTLSTCLKTVFLLQLLAALGYQEHTARHSLGPIVYRLLEAVQYNTHPIDGLAGRVDPATNVNLTELGSAVYPTLASCLNHSCDPSTVRICVGSRVALFARRNMEVGEEVSDCYGFHYTGLAREERRKRIAKWFNFQCCCPACSGQFPTMAGLTDRLGQKNLDLLKELLQKFQWSLKEGKTKKSLDMSTQYLDKLRSLGIKRPHKAWEAGSHALSCSLWAIHGDNCSKEL